MVSGTMEDGVGIFFMKRKENAVSPAFSNHQLTVKASLDAGLGPVLGIAPAEQKRTDGGIRGADSLVAGMQWETESDKCLEICTHHPVAKHDTCYSESLLQRSLIKSGRAVVG